jgi:hypothetical protein
VPPSAEGRGFLASSFGLIDFVYTFKRASDFFFSFVKNKIIYV